MPDLEQQLTALGRAMDWPVTPDIAGRIRPGLLFQRTPWYQTRWAMAAAALFVVLAALLAYTPARDALAGFLNLHSIIQRTSNPPAPPSPASGPVGRRLGLGTQTTLQSARSKLSWRILLPSGLGQPDEVYLQQPPDGPPEGEVSLVYYVRPGIPVSGQTGVALLITEARGATNSVFFGKMLGSDATLEEVTVSGHQGYWISGHPHVFFFMDANGQVRDETMRLATNTLIFDDDGTVVRIEGDISKAQALQIGSSPT